MVWNFLGGDIDWHGLPVAVELFGIHDVEALIMALIVIRDYQRQQ